MRRPVVLGVGLFAGALGTPPLLACSCGPTPTPMMETCADAASATATSATLHYALGSDAGATIDDGDPLPVVYGAQGGQHLQLTVDLVGDAIPSCVAQRTTLALLDGELVTEASTNVRVEVREGGGRTRDIFLFPGGAPPRARLRVEIAGLVLERTLGEDVILDAGSSDGSAP